MSQRKVVLASNSPRRHDLLKRLGLRFAIVQSDYKEDMTLKLPPRELAKTLALGKAEAVAKRYKNAIVIGADTFVVFKDKPIGKPRSAAEARKMLSRVSGKTVSILTGLAVIDTADGRSISKVSEAKVSFRKMLYEEIDAYVRTGEPLDKASAFAVQGLGSVFIKKIEGDLSGIVGLPLGVLASALKKFGVKVF